MNETQYLRWQARHYRSWARNYLWACAVAAVVGTIVGATGLLSVVRTLLTTGPLIFLWGAVVLECVRKRREAERALEVDNGLS